MRGLLFVIAVAVFAIFSVEVRAAVVGTEATAEWFFSGKNSARDPSCVMSIERSFVNLNRSTAPGDYTFQTQGDNPAFHVFSFDADYIEIEIPKQLVDRDDSDDTIPLETMSVTIETVSIDSHSPDNFDPSSHLHVTDTLSSDGKITISSINNPPRAIAYTVYMNDGTFTPPSDYVWNARAGATYQISPTVTCYQN